MVRSPSKPPGDESKKKPRKPSTTVWPCKMQGCNKQFAREADLKRHQRTTKLHSAPGFACPQCDAAFTRTDALRRHQKSRHNGMLGETMDVDNQGGESIHEVAPEASGSRSESRSPPSNGQTSDIGHGQPKGKQSMEMPLVGASASHYRMHTEQMSATLQHPPRLLDGQYGIGIPTSSTRLKPSSWPPPSSQAESSAPGSSSHRGSSYYRPGGTTRDSREPSPPPHHIRARSPDPERPHDRLPSSRSTSPRSWRDADTRRELHSPEPRRGSSPLPLPTRRREDSRERATHEQVEYHRALSPRHVSGPRTPLRGERAESSHGYGPSLDRPEPMEHMMTEDGEPMLNPAELLTQESLASPPSS